MGFATTFAGSQIIPFFPALSLIPGSQRPLPDWAQVHQELRRKGVTLLLLWQECKARWPEGFQYSRFCELYREWAKKLDLSMRQEHRAGRRCLSTTAGRRCRWWTERAAGRRRPSVGMHILMVSPFSLPGPSTSASAPAHPGETSVFFSPVNVLAFAFRAILGPATPAGDFPFLITIVALKLSHSSRIFISKRPNIHL